MRKTIKVSNIDCAQCAKTIETYFDSQDNIDAKVLVTAKKVIFNYDENIYDEESIGNHLRTLGYYPIFDSKEQIKRKRLDTIDILIAFILSLPLIWTMAFHLGAKFILVPDILLNGYFQFALTTPILFFSGRRFFKAFYFQVKYKNLGMDALVAIGTTTAYIYSIIETIRHQGSHHAHYYFETTAVIILMVLIGNYFENRVKEKTSNALQSLVSLGAKEARLLVGDTTRMVSVDDIKLNDIIVVLANEKIPVDGLVIAGKSYVDEAMLTGESMPVSKDVNSKVIGSSFNINTTLHIKVTATGSETVLAKIIQTVEDTALIKPKAQRIADKIASVFVPIVLILSVLTFITWFLILQKPLIDSIGPAIAVLAISCPCALGLATPTSISVSSGIAFKRGILYKGGEFFEIANKIKAIAFDKTGTLTTGKPVVSEFKGDQESLVLTASIESYANHPIAKAITKYYKGKKEQVEDFETLVGLGIKGKIRGKDIYVGSIKLLESIGITHIHYEYEHLLEQGKTVFFTVFDQQVVNMIAIEDQIKDTAIGTINALKNKGITPYMITGDQLKTASYVAKILGIEHVVANVLPHEKAEVIQKIQAEHGITAFIGDGINDAPALKMADVGFAVSEGSDIALDSADVTLMNYDLMLVVDAIDLSKATLKNIYLNFFWAFIYNICMIPLAALGYLSPSLAGIGMGFSSIMVVLNALSLNLFKFKKIKEESA